MGRLVGRPTGGQSLWRGVGTLTSAQGVGWGAKQSVAWGPSAHPLYGLAGALCLVAPAGVIGGFLGVSPPEVALLSVWRGVGAPAGAHGSFGASRGVWLGGGVPTHFCPRKTPRLVAPVDCVWLRVYPVRSGVASALSLSAHRHTHTRKHARAHARTHAHVFLFMSLYVFITTLYVRLCFMAVSTLPELHCMYVCMYACMYSLARMPGRSSGWRRGRGLSAERTS